jgi:NADH dehydrogenase
MSSGPDATPSHADVLVLGASYAGVEVAYQLYRQASKPLRVIVVDRDREHGYLPLVQERLLGTIAIDASKVRTSAYIEALPGARFVQGEIVRLDPESRTVELADGTTLGARVIVVALGSVLEPPAAIVGAERLLAHKSPTQFEALRGALDRVLVEGAAPRIVVVGGGISGVELAGELAALEGAASRPWPVAPKVTIVGSQERLVSILPAKVGARAQRLLAGQGVDVRTSTRVVEVGDGWVDVVAGGERSRIECALAVWVGGIAPAPILAALGLPRTADGWLAVGPTLQCFPEKAKGRPEIFACGDAVRIVGGEGEWPTMQRAIECIWQAKLVARNALTLLDETPDYPDGVPPLRPHVLHRTFAYGVSLGRRSLVVWGPICLDLRGVNHWFRRWLMRQYIARYPAP